MINGDHSNLHILHRALTNEHSNCERDDGDATADAETPNHQDNEHDAAHEQAAQPHFVPVSPLLPRGLEYEVPGLDDNFQLTPAALETSEGSERRRPLLRLNLGAYVSNDSKLLISFVLLVVFGTGNVVTAKLQADSMYNYGIFLSLLSYVIYVPLCFAFIIPVAKYGLFHNAITPEHLALSRKSFAIMGFLDCLSAVMQTFASIYLPGPLLVLLPQAAIPLSMLLSKHMLGERYKGPQYVGAIVVFCGLLIVLEPVITYRRAPAFLCEAVDLEKHCTICSGAKTKVECSQINEDSSADKNKINLGIELSSSLTRIMLLENDTVWQEDPQNGICDWIALGEASTNTELSVFIWSAIMVLSCVPMTLSSIYKRVKLRSHGDLNPVFLFGWIGAFQFLFSILLAPSVGLATGIPLTELPKNVWEGVKCYFFHGSVDTGCHPDSRCSAGHAFLFVNLCLVCQGVSLLAMVFVLKYGSSSSLFLALTMMVPLGNLAFSLPIMASPSTMHASDVIALLVIVAGLLLYRLGHEFPKRTRTYQNNPSSWTEEEPTSEVSCHPLLEPLISYAYV